MFKTRAKGRRGAEPSCVTEPQITPPPSGPKSVVVSSTRRALSPYAPTIKNLEEQVAALEMRKSGFTYDQIAEVLKVPVKDARSMIASALSHLREVATETAHEVREIELRRLDALLETIWEKRAKPRVADSILRIMERRSKLLGLDAAAQVDIKVTGYEALTDDQLREKVSALMEEASPQEVVEVSDFTLEGVG